MQQHSPADPGQQITVTFELPDGSEQRCRAAAGETLMDAALDNGVPGIVAQCGGGCTCCTCHCWVLSPWLEQLPAPHRDERDMLEYAWGACRRSRLACQVTLVEALDGIRVQVPAQQS